MIIAETMRPTTATGTRFGRSEGERTRHWDNSPGQPSERRKIVTLFAECPSIEALSFLRQAQGSERFYWSEPVTRPERLTMAGAGIAAEIIVPPVLKGQETIHDQESKSRFALLADQACELFAGSIIMQTGMTETNRPKPDSRLTGILRPRLFGGFSFTDTFTPDNTWSIFSPAHFILPHYLYLQIGGDRFLAINALVGADEDMGEVLQALEEALMVRLQLNEPVNATTHANQPIDWRYPMTPEMWTDLIEKATTEIHAGRMEKVVLARVCEIRFDQAVDTIAAMVHLNQFYDDCYRFHFEPVPHHAFFGATPELLVSKRKQAIETMALAGSVGRGKTEAEDEQLANRLLGSAKDRHEQNLVIDGIAGQLKAIADRIDIPEVPTVLKLRNIQHLYSPITARQTPGANTSVLDLAERLHPTPALGGVPTSESLKFIQDAESVPRGWYAAPIGWFDDRLDGVFAVGIRAAVTQVDRAWLYAGAGIVAASQADKEWDETALKFKPMLEALGVRGDDR